MYQPNELKYSLNKVGIKAIVAAEEFRHENYYEMLTSIIPELNQHKASAFLDSPHVPSLRNIIMISQQQRSGTWRLQDVVDNSNSKTLEDISNMQRQIQFDEPANIQFTSGTTGNPKGATLSHHNIVNNGYLLGFRIGYHMKSHRICLPVPLYHCFGCVAGVLTAAAHGATCVFPSPSFSAKKAIQAIELERCTSLYGTPTMFVDMLNLGDLKEHNLTSLSTGIMSGAPCPQELVKAVVNDLHMKDFVVMYGMTETSPVTFQCYHNDPVEIRHSTVGYPSDHTEVKIVDQENQIVPVNVPGELCVRGYSTMLGYWNDEEKTREFITNDRWLHTGDIAFIDGRGYGQIVGRAKDMLIRGGENIYPREIEDLLHTHPAVAEVYVIGVPDRRLGEEVCAWIRLKADAVVTEEEFKEFCHHKIAYFKIPKYWLFKEDFPKTVTGKIQKYQMREITIRELQLME